MTQSTDSSQPGRCLIYGRRVLLAMVVTVTAVLTTAVVEIVLHNSAFGTTAPPDLPEQARAGFEKIKSEVVYQSSPLVFHNRLVGGITVLHSPLLARSFPNYCFVRVSFTRACYLWTPRTWGPSYGGPYSIVCVIPLDGENSAAFYHFSRYELAGDFFSRNALKVRTQGEAERVRRILLELFPRTRTMFGQHEQVSNTEWLIAVNGTTFIQVKTDSDGRVQHMENRLLTNQNNQPQRRM